MIFNPFKYHEPLMTCWLHKNDENWILISLNSVIRINRSIDCAISLKVFPQKTVFSWNAVRCYPTYCTWINIFQFNYWVFFLWQTYPLKIQNHRLTLSCAKTVLDIRFWIPNGIKDWLNIYQTILKKTRRMKNSQC